MNLNIEQAQQLAMRVIGDQGGAFVMALGYIGDRLGLFKAMAGAGALTSQDLAGRTGLNERYVREWLRAMVAAEYLDYDAGTDTYRMTDEQAFVFVNEDSPLFVGGAMQITAPTIFNVPKIMNSFRAGGGVCFHEMGEDIPCGIERTFGPGYKNFLVNDWLAKVPGLIQRLQWGARVADIGCGRGLSTIEMAKAFPESKFLGIDLHAGSIEGAWTRARAAGLGNVAFLAISADELPQDNYDLICSFDCIHDMANPLGALKAIRSAMADDGCYLWSEPNASHNAAENRNPIGKVFHSISPLHCMTVSLANEGAGLGTVIGEAGARKLAETAGFSSFGRLPVENPFNQFFLLRK
jgi:2-polyprenyl-3-methyl-5-hydroxy-6-metoxy-1,4-benzoquinol methylase